MSERDHQEARGIAARLIGERWRLFTTNLVVAEIHALVLIRVNRRTALRVLDDLDTSPTTTIRVTEEDERRARVILHQYHDKDFSLADAASFAVMERLAIAHAFTFDRHFVQFGFRRLTAGGT